MRKTLLFLCCAATNLCGQTAQEEQQGQMEIESQRCDYDGKKLSLSGSISFVHELGKIVADEAVLFADPDEKKLSLGLLKISNNVVITSKDGSQLTCDEGLINPKTMQGNFSGNVNVYIQGKGTLTTDNELEIHYHNVNGKRQLRSIESNGYTTLTSPEKEEGHFHFLYCYGKLFVDHEKLITTFDSPVDDQGKILPGNQVVFRDRLGEMHADKLSLYYQDIEGKITPVRLIAEGNVFLLDRKGAPANQEVPLIHYALADRVKFEFVGKEALFTAAKSNRVLFYDKTNNLQISAPALKLKRDGGNNKESIQGIGDVRFSFMENEVQQMKARFEQLPHRY